MTIGEASHFTRDALLQVGPRRADLKRWRRCGQPSGHLRGYGLRNEPEVGAMKSRAANPRGRSRRLVCARAANFGAKSGRCGERRAADPRHRPFDAASRVRGRTNVSFRRTFCEHKEYCGDCTGGAFHGCRAHPLRFKPRQNQRAGMEASFQPNFSAQATRFPSAE